MTEFAISKPSVIVNDNPVNILPNTFKFGEGLGETTVRTQSAGGGSVESVISDNAEDKLGKFSFEMANTPGNIALARGWKQNPGVNSVDSTGSGNFSRIFNNSSITNDYEVTLSTDGNIALEWAGDAPI